MLDRDRAILVFGAGNIGLSFVGQIFSRAGYRVVFADTDDTLRRRINRYGRYEVVLLDPAGGATTYRIEPVEAIDPRDADALRHALSMRPIVATAVGARAFPHVLRSLAGTQNLDIIAAENIHNPRSIAKDILGSEAPGIHACSVGKMVPLQTRPAAGPLSVRAESFNSLIVDGTDWRRPPPDDVPWIRYVDDIEPWMDRKLFIHNLGHATCAWCSRRIDPSIETIADAMELSKVSSIVREVMGGMASVVGTTYPDAFGLGDLSEHVEDLLVRFGNPALGDTVERVGRDLERKLGGQDRLIGAMRLCIKTKNESVLDSLARVALDALRFGLTGYATMDADIAISSRADIESPAELITKIGGLDRDDAIDSALVSAIEAVSSAG